MDIVEKIRQLKKKRMQSRWHIIMYDRRYRKLQTI